MKCGCFPLKSFGFEVFISKKTPNYVILLPVGNIKTKEVKQSDSNSSQSNCPLRSFRAFMLRLRKCCMSVPACAIKIRAKSRTAQIGKEVARHSLIN